MPTTLHARAEREGHANYLFATDLEEQPFEKRHYRVYAFLADVRNTWHLKPIMSPRGFPEDASPQTRFQRMQHGVLNTHHAGFVYLQELYAYDYTQPVRSENVSLREFLGEDYFAELERLKGERIVRIVFWFTN